VISERLAPASESLETWSNVFVSILDNATRVYDAPQFPDCLNAKSSEERVVYKRLNSTGKVDSENNHGGSS
jgi:hypothetical protein